MNLIRSESGISLIELAIVVPVVLLLISGMIDMGFSINRVKSVVSASRQAARVAASHSKFLARPVPCGSPISTSCDALAPFSDTPSVTEVAAHAACTYVEHNAGARSNWFVEIPSPEFTPEDRVEFQTARVSLEFVGRRCFLCMHELFASFEARSSSSFVLEGVCK